MIMEKAFVYGMSVGGNNFTDRIEETKRIKLDFENGVNVILISPRRMGKSSLIKKVISEIDNPMLKIVYIKENTFFRPRRQPMGRPNITYGTTIRICQRIGMKTFLKILM